MERKVVPGTITRIYPDKGYGFIEGEDRKWIFFHKTSILNFEIEQLRVGDYVAFITITEEDGRLSAGHVRRIYDNKEEDHELVKRSEKNGKNDL